MLFVKAGLSLLAVCIINVPSLLIVLALIAVQYAEFAALPFILMFAYYIAKGVKSIYETKDISSITDRHHSTRSGEDKQGRYSYTIDADENIHFTIRCKDTDGRQLNRLKFIATKYFERHR